MNTDRIVEDIYNLGKPAKNEKERLEKFGDIKEIVEPLLKLIEEARKKKLYLRLTDKVFRKFIEDEVLRGFDERCRWMSPNGLEEELKKGNILYIADAWDLVNPVLRVEEMQNEIVTKMKELKKFTREVALYINSK